MELKKILAAALAVTVIGGALPVSAATAAEEIGDGVIITDVSTSGKFGDISWELDRRQG